MRAARLAASTCIGACQRTVCAFACRIHTGARAHLRCALERCILVDMRLLHFGASGLLNGLHALNVVLRYHGDGAPGATVSTVTLS